MLIITLVVLLLVANGAPLLAGHWLHSRCFCAIQRPIDGGYCCRDGHRLLGKSKTWQGLLSALLITTIAAAILKFPLPAALLLALLAMAGDLISSFIKRRLHCRSGLNVPGLDQLPESLLPMLGVSLLLPLSPLQVILPVLLFILIHILLTECLSALHFHPKHCRKAASFAHRDERP